MTPRFGRRFVPAPALLLVIALLVMLMPGGPRVSRAAQEAPVQGDVTCDSSVNAVDSLQILRDVAGLGTTAGCLAGAGDVNCDGAVNSVDSLRILRYVAGLPATAPDGCAPIGEPLVAGPNSYELIQAAFDAGDIDAETALKYRIFAAFGDPRLPAVYQGDDGDVWDDPGTVSELSATFDALSPGTQEVLAPFLLFWDAPGSWFQQRLAAEQVAAALPNAPVETIDGSPHVRVWYRLDQPGAAQQAEALAAEIDAKIWPTLTGLMGEPMEDTARPNDGGDGRIDILLSGIAQRSYAHYEPGCKETSGFVVLGAGADKYVLTHELMHVIVARFALNTPCEYPEYRWINEATAQWSIDFVYPNAQREWGSPANPVVLKCFLDHPNLSLERRNDCHEYSAYLLLFYLHRNHNEQLIRDIWDAFKGEDSLGGINAALAAIGGLKEVWPKFVLQNYNRPPETWYKTFDNIPVGALLEAEEDVSLGGAHLRKYALRGDADHLAALYHEYTFTDPAINEVTFKHSLVGQPTAFVRALIKYQGDAQWKDEDWTGDPEKKFCYDNPGQKKFEKLIVIISNSEYQNRSHVLSSSPQPELKVTDECGHGWHGTASGTYDADYGYGDTESATVTANIEWVEDPDFWGAGGGCPCRTFLPTGTIDWEWESTAGDSHGPDHACHDADSGHTEAGVDTNPPLQWLTFWDDPDDEFQYLYSGLGRMNLPRDNSCEPGVVGTFLVFFDIPDPYIGPPSAISTHLATPAVQAASTPLCDDAPFKVAKDATSFSGSCFGNDAGTDEFRYRYEWSFTLTEPAPQATQLTDGGAVR